MRRLIFITLALSIALTGCDYVQSFFKEEKPVKKQAGTTTPPKQVEPEKPTPPPPRVISLGMTPPIEVKECQIKLTAPAGQVPAILQVSSYVDKQTESYPSVFIQAVAPSSSLADILEQPLQAKVYVALAAAGPFYSTPDGQPAQLTLKLADDQHVLGTIENATLVDQASGQKSTASGKFDGKMHAK
ncbi:MAG: hypothetical protein K8T91_27205 [Planctomycetes bacterium]|nr:hypothetical protein [Planctomycetota bacterium]